MLESGWCDRRHPIVCSTHLLHNFRYFPKYLPFTSGNEASLSTPYFAFSSHVLFWPQLSLLHIWTFLLHFLLIFYLLFLYLIIILQITSTILFPYFTPWLGGILDFPHFFTILGVSFRSVGYEWWCYWKFVFNIFKGIF